MSPVEVDFKRYTIGTWVEYGKSWVVEVDLPEGPWFEPHGVGVKENNE